MTIFLRGSTYHLRKRVPLQFRSIEDRPIIGVSLKTDSPTEARRKAEEIWANMLDGWQKAIDGDHGNARARHDAAKAIAQRRGFTFAPVAVLASDSHALDDVIARAKASVRPDGSPNQIVGNALLGGVPEPRMTIREALEEFWKIAVAG